MTKTVKAAVIGTGFIGTVHCEGVRRAGGEVVGVMASSTESSKRAGDRLGVPAFSTLDELLGSDADVVHITSPNNAHAAQAIAALQAGKHVVCEKPLATSLAEGEQMAAAAEASGKVAALNFNIRFYPLHHEAKARLARGDIGAPVLVHGRYLQDWLMYDTDWNWRLDAEVGGPTRALSDIGSHWLDLVTFITGLRIDSVQAMMHTVHPTRRRPRGEVETYAKTDGQELIEVDVTTDDVALVLMRFSNGAPGSLVVSQVSAGRKNHLEWEIDGKAGSLGWASERPDELMLGHRDEPNQLFFRDPGAMDATAARISFYPGGHVEGFGETFRGLFERVYEDVRAGGPTSEPAYPTFADGLVGLAVEEAIRRSAATGQWTEVGEI